MTSYSALGVSAGQISLATNPGRGYFRGDTPLEFVPNQTYVYNNPTNKGGIVPAGGLVIDGGQEHLLIDNQVSNGKELCHIQVLRNVFGGHTDISTFGRYMPLLDHDDRGTVETIALQNTTPTAILWPTSGPDANTSGECSDLTPDRTGQVVLP